MKKFLMLSGLILNFYFLSAQKATFNYTGVKETFEVPCGVDQIRVTAIGADGGNAAVTEESNASGKGGSGARVSANFEVNAGDVFEIVVGQAGGSIEGLNGSGGGGGGSGIRYQNAPGNTVLLVAGGGGGGFSGIYTNGMDQLQGGRIDPFGGGYQFSTGGIDGNGGLANDPIGGTGGGGIFSVGDSVIQTRQCNKFENTGIHAQQGGQGGFCAANPPLIPCQTPNGCDCGPFVIDGAGTGGFGVGGGGNGGSRGAGGGGGYSGGGGGSSFRDTSGETPVEVSYAAGGGGSYVSADGFSATFQEGISEGGTQSHGMIMIEYIKSDRYDENCQLIEVPALSTWGIALLILLVLLFGIFILQRNPVSGI